MTELFRGFVPTRNKKCLIKFKDEDLNTLEEVERLPEYAGVLNRGVILIDVDNSEQAELLMNIVEEKQLDCRVYQTNRGKHFVFLNNGVAKCATGAKLACGITADIKLGDRNSYEILKINGEDRFIEWDIVEGGDYQPIPKWLTPIKSDVDFFTMDDGDGRNSALYSYILTLTGAGFSKDESRETLSIINQFVLKTPLQENELETIFRDEAFPKETFFNGNSFLHDAFATFLLNNDNIKRINGQLHIFKEGEYVNGARELEAKMVKYLPNLKAFQRQETWKYLDIVAPDAQPADARYIAFANGILDIASRTLLPFSPEFVITNKIPWNYNADAHSELADKTLDRLACGDSEVRALLEECIGYCFYRRNELSKAFVLTGDKANGKSTFLEMVTNVLGKENCSALDLAELDERFSVATMGGKLANIGDDISDEFLQGKSVAMFKKIVSGNDVKAEVKNDPNVFFMRPYVKLLFSANDIPRMKDKTGAVLRRLVIVPFNAHFSKTDPDYDPYIVYKLRDKAVMEYLIKLGVEGLLRVLENKDFSNSKKVNKALEEYEIKNNPILLFVQDVGVENILNHSINEVHAAYRVYCLDNGFTEMTLLTFSKEIQRKLNCAVSRTTINHKKTRVFVQNA